MTQEQWKALYGDAPSQFTRCAKRTVSKMQRQKPPYRPSRASAAVLMALCAIAVALVVEWPFFRDTLLPAGQDTPLSALAAEPTPIIPAAQDTFLMDSLAEMYGYDMSHLATLIDNHPAQQSVFYRYAQMSVDQMLWDGENLYLAVSVTPKEGYYLVDFDAEAELRAAQEASANAENRQVIYPIISCIDPDGFFATLSCVYDAGSMRSCVKIHAPYYEDGFGEDLLVALKLSIHPLTKKDVAPFACGYALFTATMKSKPLLYTGQFVKSYISSKSVNTMPFDVVYVDVISTPVETKVKYQYRLTNVSPADSLYVALEWLDENAMPYAQANKKANEDDWTTWTNDSYHGYVEKTATYEGRSDIPESMMLRFYDDRTDQEMTVLLFIMKDQGDNFDGNVKTFSLN